MMVSLTRVVEGMAPADVFVRREGDVWKVECRFGKISLAPGSVWRRTFS